MKPFFLNHSRVIWHTYPERVFSLLDEAVSYSWRIASHVTACDSYENYILRSHPEIKTISPKTVEMLIDEHINSRHGYLTSGGHGNIFLLKGKQNELYALRAQEVPGREAGEKKLHLTISEVPKLGIGPDWGAYRPAGTEYRWELN